MNLRKMPKAADSRSGEQGPAVLVLAAVLLAISVSSVFAATKPAKGRLLVATEKITDPRFHEAVILIVRHDEKGTVGLIVNKPLPVSLGHVFPALPDDLSGEQPLFFGGPVGPGTVWVIFSGEKPAADTVTILPDVHVGRAEALFGRGDFRPDRNSVRILAGYAGWGPGQLEAELRRGDWTVTPASRTDLFDADPESLWKDLGGSGGILI